MKTRVFRCPCGISACRMAFVKTKGFMLSVSETDIDDITENKDFVTNDTYEVGHSFLSKSQLNLINWFLSEHGIQCHDDSINDKYIKIY